MNPSDVAAFAVQGGLAAEALHAGTVTIGATNYTASIGRAPLEISTGEGGMIYEGQRLVRIRKAVLATAPAVGSRMTIENRVWEVKSCTSTPMDPKWTIRLEPLSKPQG